MHCNTFTFRTLSIIDQTLLKVAPKLAGECASVIEIVVHVLQCFIYMLQHLFIEDIEEQMKLLEAKK